MGFHGEDKNLVRTFFVGHRKAICQMITDYTNSCNELPSIDRFIRMLAEYIRLLPSDKFADIKRVMTLDNMNDDTELIQANFNKVAKGIKIPQQPPPPPAPTPASSSSEPEFSGGYLTNNDDSKRRLVAEQGLVDADAVAAINLGDPKEHESTLKGVRSRGDYLHRTCKSHGPYGVKNQRYGGGKVVTFLYRRQGGTTYLVGMAEHITSSVYHVTRNFITDLIKGDRLTF